jgi:hypothetical protein
MIIRNIATMAVIVMLTGCVSSPARIVYEVGAGDSGMLSEKTLDGNVHLSDVVRVKVGAEWSVFNIPDGMSLEVGIGVANLSAGNMPGSATGIDTMFRLTAVPQNKISPYVVFTASYDKFSEVWEPTEVDYGFTNTFGAGFSYDLDSKSRLYIDYRWLHNSWGSTFHTQGFRDTFGLAGTESDPNPGFESGIFTIGYGIDF